MVFCCLFLFLGGIAVLMKKLFIVVFRMVVFRPFVSEVIIAKVKSSDEEGIRRAFCLCHEGMKTYLTPPSFRQLFRRPLYSSCLPPTTHSIVSSLSRTY
jgi:hypothetical protein